MRDRAAKGWRERKMWYRVGSVFKACYHCGSTDVFRSYKPWVVKWTYKCFECLSTDANCWENPQNLGEEPRILPREEAAAWKREQRKTRDLALKEERLADEIAEIKARIAELEEESA